MERSREAKKRSTEANTRETDTRHAREEVPGGEIICTPGLSAARRWCGAAWSWLARRGVPILLVCSVGWASQEWVCGLGFVPSSSMQGSLLPGDLVVIARGAYDHSGPVGTALRRMGLGELERGDIVVIANPAAESGWRAPPWEDLSRLEETPDTRRAHLGAEETVDRLVKRIVALPGDTVDVRGGSLLINGKPETEPATLQDYWTLTVAAASLRKADLYWMGVQDVTEREGAENEGSYVAGPASSAQIEAIRAWKSVEHVSRCTGCTSPQGRWYVPGRGIKINPEGHEDAERLAWMIATYEGKAASVTRSGKLKVEGRAVDGYVFDRTYVFVAGDNRPGSVDSRTWGPVPVSSTRGKVVRIAASWSIRARALRTGRFWRKPTGIPQHGSRF